MRKQFFEARVQRLGAGTFLSFSPKPQAGSLSIPQRFQHPLRSAVVQKGHGQIDQRGLVVGNKQAVVAGEFANHGCFDILALAQAEQRGQVRGRHRNNHAFLGFGKPDFPGLQPGVFERHIVERHTHANGGPHFAHRR